MGNQNNMLYHVMFQGYPDVVNVPQLCEMLGGKMTAKRFRLFALTPCIGVLGVVISLPMWFPVVASAVCFTMLPIAYFIFFWLNNDKGYIGSATGKGWRRALFNVILIAALIFACIGSFVSLKKNVFDKFAQPKAASTPVVEIEDHAPLGAPQDEATSESDAVMETLVETHESEQAPR